MKICQKIDLTFFTFIKFFCHFNFEWKDKKNIKKLSDLFIDYKIKKVKIENKIISSRDVNGEVNIDWSEIWKEKNYIEIFENSLKNLPKQDYELLVSVYLDNKLWDELSYSYSTFYKKLKKAEKLFLSFFN